jgi:hypothetical protein
MLVFHGVANPLGMKRRHARRSSSGPSNVLVLSVSVRFTLDCFASGSQ